MSVKQDDIKNDDHDEKKKIKKRVKKEGDV